MKQKKDKKIRSFRTIVMVLLGTVMTVFLLVLFFMQRGTMLRLLLQSENYYFENRIDTANALIAQQMEEARKRGRDVAAWEGLADAIEGGAGEGTLADEWSLISPKYDSDVDFVIVLDADGGERMRASYDPQGEIEALPDTLWTRITRLAQELMAAETGTVRMGIIFDRETPYYLYCAQVVPSGGRAPVGTVTVGLRLDDAFFARVTQFEDFAFSLYYMPEQTIEPGVLVFDRVQEDTLSVRSGFADMDGTPIELMITAPRHGYQEGRATLYSTTVFMVFTCVLFAVLMALVIRRNILRPMAQLGRDLKQSFTEGLNPDAYKQNQEFADLCREINALVQRLNDSKMSMDVFDRILNGMNVYLYVSEPATGEVLYVNDKMIEHFGIEGSPVGKPCWRLLEGQQTDRCAYCPLPELLLEPDRVITWEEQNRSTGRFYRNTDALIDWIDGRKAHLHHRVDISDIKQAESTLTRRLKQQEIMSDISRGFIEYSDADSFIENALRMAGEFVDAARTLITRLDPETGVFSLAYEWASESKGARPLTGRFRSYSAGHPIYDALVTEGRLYLAVEDVAEVPQMAYMATEGVGGSLSMPIIIEERLWGIMSVAVFGSTRKWSPSDIHLFTMISSIVAAMLQRKASQADLLRMSSIVESSPNFMAYVNAEGDFDYFNNGAMKNTGYSSEELSGGGLRMLLGDERLGYVNREIFPQIRKQGQFDFELPMMHKNGEERTFAFSGFTIGAHQGDIGTIANDVTMQKQMEKDIIAAKDEAERSNHAKSDFLSRMSHEMRTPMNAIIGMTNMAKGSDDAEKKEYCLDKISEASTHLLGVINDILDMSKIEANKFELSYTEFNFERMLRKISNIVAFRVDEKHQNFIIEIDPAIPRTVFSDEQRLAQVITNLLSNATKFTPEEGTIWLNARLLADHGDELEIEFDVTDTGIGITPEQQSRLFRAFEQADGGVSRRFGGTGLGLAISKRIVEMMGGTIYIRSEEGRGASFIFNIMAKRGTAPARTGQTAGVDMSRLHVLAVDDAPEVREYFLGLADQLGFACDVAADGYDACRMAEKAEQPYDIAFVDWRMPGMDGIELTQRLKALKDAPTAVIMISAAEWNDMEERAHAAGVDRFVSKPLFASVIVDCISEVFGSPDHAPEGAQGKPEQINFAGRHILLAEDIDINREIVLALLEPTGMAVDVAENGLQALAKFAQSPALYDLVFMDIHMPEMDGYEATRQIRALDVPEAKTTPIVAMTANVFREDIERCLAAGMNDHIGKPIDVGEFFAKLQKNLPEKKK